MAELLHTQIRITGMGCASCVGRVEGALRATPGVCSAEVNFATKTADITYETSFDEILDALNTAGYPAATRQIRLDIDGMTCASCVKRIERILQASPGVSDVAVNLATKSATVTYAEGVTEAAMLAKTLTEAGYPARPQAEDGADHNCKIDEFAGQRRATVFAAMLVLPVFCFGNGRAYDPCISPLGSFYYRPSSKLSDPVCASFSAACRSWPGVLHQRYPITAEGRPRYERAGRFGDRRGISVLGPRDICAAGSAAMHS